MDSIAQARRNSALAAGSAQALSSLPGTLPLPSTSNKFTGVEFVGAWKNALIEDYEGNVDTLCDAATKLAEVAGLGHMEAVEQLLVVADSTSLPSFTRCLAITALGSAGFMSVQKKKRNDKEHKKSIATIEGEKKSKVRDIIALHMGGGDESDDSDKELLRSVPLDYRDRRSVAKPAHELPVYCVPAGRGSIVGDERTIDVLIDALTDTDCDVRLEAVKALAHVSKPDDTDVITALADRIDDESLVVRPAAVRSLAHVSRILNDDTDQHLASKSKRNCELAVRYLIAYTQRNYDTAVRIAAAEGLACVSQRGHGESLDAVSKLLVSGQTVNVVLDADVPMSDNLQGIFGRNLKPSQHHRHDARDDHSDDEREAHEQEIRSELDGSALRRAAAASLSKLAPFGSKAAQSALLTVVDDVCSEVRAAALVGVVTIAGTSSTLTREVVLEKMQDPDAEVRTIAAMWLGEVGHAPVSEQVLDSAAISAAVSALSDICADVRRHAALALARLSPVGDKNVLKALESQLEDKDWGARRAAADTLRSLLNNTIDEGVLRMYHQSS